MIFFSLLSYVWRRKTKKRFSRPRFFEKQKQKSAHTFPLLNTPHLKTQLQQQQGYAYGFSRMSFSATQLTYEVLESPPPSATNNQEATAVDTLLLSKPLGWTPPSPAAQRALYASIAVTPEPPVTDTDTATATIVYLLKCLLLPEATVQKLASRFVAPGSESWSNVYVPRTEWTPNQHWASTVAFLDVMRAMGPGFEKFEIYKSWRALTSPGGRTYFPDAASGYGGIGPP